ICSTNPRTVTFRCERVSVVRARTAPQWRDSKPGLSGLITMTARPFGGEDLCSVAGGSVFVGGTPTQLLPLKLAPEYFEDASRELQGCNGEPRCGVLFKGDGCPFGRL